MARLVPLFYVKESRLSKRPCLSVRGPIALCLLGIATVAFVAACASAQGTFVVVGSGGEIQTSPDGHTWTKQTSGVSTGLQDVATDGNLWVAVGGAVILTSPDAVEWTPQPSPVSGLRAVATNGTHWVAVGDGGTIIASPDAMTWTQQATGVTQDLWDVAGSGTQWVAVDGDLHCIGSVSCPPALFYTSRNGVTWTASPSPILYGARRVTYGNGAFVAVGQGLSAPAASFATSADGLAWTTADHGAYRAMAAAHDGSTWLVVGQAHGSQVNAAGVPISTSPDGSNWASTTNSYPALHDAAGDGCNWVVLRPSAIITSTDTTTWNDQAMGAMKPLAVAAMANPCAPPTCSPATQTALVGATVTFSATGAIPPYTWTAPGSMSPGATTGIGTTRVYNTAGTYAVTLTSSASSTPLPSTTCTVQVFDAPPTCMPRAQTILVGDTADLSAAGGIPPYTWSAPGSDVPLQSGSPQVSLRYPNPGTYLVRVAGQQTTPRSECLVTVVDPVAENLVCVPGQIRGLPEETFVFAAFEGTPPYSWVALGSSNDLGNGIIHATSYSSPGRFAIHVMDASSPPQTAQCQAIVADPFMVCLPAAEHARQEKATHAGQRQDLVVLGSQSVQFVASETVFDVNYLDTSCAPTVEKGTPCIAPSEGAPAEAGEPSCNPHSAGTLLPQGPTLPRGRANPPIAAFTTKSYTFPRGNLPIEGPVLDASPQAIQAPAGAGPLALPAPESPPFPWELIGSATAIAFLWRLRGQAVGTIVLLFTRLRQSQILDHPLRAQIHQVVLENPGIHFRQLMRQVQRGQGVVKHHVEILVLANLLRRQETKTKGHSRFFVADIEDPNLIAALMALRTPATMRVMRVILDYPGTTLEQVVERTGFAYGTVRGHVKKLRASNLVQGRLQNKFLYLYPGQKAHEVLASASLDQGRFEAPDETAQSAHGNPTS